MFEIDLAPILKVGLEIMAGALLAVVTWTATRLAKMTGIDIDDKARAYYRAYYTTSRQVVDK